MTPGKVFAWILLIVSAVLINLYFLHNAHFFLENFGVIGSRMDIFILNSISAQGRIFGLNLQPHTPPFRVFKDLETLVMCLVIISCSFFLTRSVPKTMQIISLCVMPLGIDVYIWDRGEFWIHVSLISSYSPYFSWFTNAIFLALSSSLFLFSSLYLHRQKLGWRLKKGFIKSIITK